MYAFSKLPGSSTKFAGPLLVIEWDSPSFSIVKFEREGNVVSLNQTFSLRSPEELSTNVAVGRWLRRELKRNGISDGKAVVVVPRRHVTTDLFEVPTHDLDEIKRFCGLQAKSKSVSDTQDVVADFLVGPPSSNGTHVFLSTISRARLQSIRESMQAGKIGVETMLVSELALGQTSAETGLVMYVLARQQRIEFVVCGDGFPLAASTFPFLENTDEVASVMPALGSRVLRSLPQHFEQSELAAVKLYGEDAHCLFPYFKNYFDVPVTGPDEQLAGNDHWLSCVQAQAASVPTINFAKAKLVSTATPRHTALSVPWTGLLVAASLLLLLVTAAYNQSLSREIDSIQAQANELADANGRKAMLIPTNRAIANWEATSVDWPKKLTELAAHLPENRRAYLSSLSAEVTRQHEAKVTGKGRARTAKTVMSVQQQLIDDQNFELRPTTIEPHSTDEYRAGFSLHVLAKPKP